MAVETAALHAPVAKKVPAPRTHHDDTFTDDYESAPENFSYTSDANIDWLSGDALMAMLGEA